MTCSNAIDKLIMKVPRKYLYLFVQSNSSSYGKERLQTRLQGEKNEQ